MLKPLEKMTPADYAEIGLKSGLEIHQQLATPKKLFCRCPARCYSETYDAEILRHMRPTLSELGEYDGTALMEFKTKKDIIYQLNKETVCTYEMDDAPPFELNDQALDISIEIALLLKCNLVNEIHIARKQYLDGSIPTGFQRTTILGIDGEIPYKDRKIGIIQLGLEEDACREVSDIQHVRTYRTDRLGIPLIEVVTYPHMRTPQEVADVAQLIRQLNRATGKVNRGIGAARQDVNVSITGGTRVEIKGVPRIPDIPLLVHNEAGRQKALLEIRDLLLKRGVLQDSFQTGVFDVSDILRDSHYLPIKEAIHRDFIIKCIRLPKFGGILNYLTQPEINFAKEVSDRIRVIACLDSFPNLIHSDTTDETIGSAGWLKIKKMGHFQPEDALVLVWGPARDVETALLEIRIRAIEAVQGVPNETRQAASDGTTSFERILPGADRMYPDTDLPPIALTEERISKIQSGLPPLPWERRVRYQAIGLAESTIIELLLTNQAALFDRLTSTFTREPKVAAFFLTQTLKHFKRLGLPVHSLDETTIHAVFKVFNQERIVREAIPLIIRCRLKQNNLPIEEVIAQFQIITKHEVGAIAEEILQRDDFPPIADLEKRKKYFMGAVMAKVRGKIAGKTVEAIVAGLVI